MKLKELDKVYSGPKKFYYHQYVMFWWQTSRTWAESLVDPWYVFTDKEFRELEIKEIEVSEYEGELRLEIRIEKKKKKKRGGVSYLLTTQVICAIIDLQKEKKKKK